MLKVKNTEETRQAYEPDSDMSKTLDLSYQEFKVIDMQLDLVQNMKNMQELMNSVTRDGI
jgi:hypothetical protein